MNVINIQNQDFSQKNNSPDLFSSELLDYQEFLGHFYNVLNLFLQSDQELNKVFNLYVVQTQKKKSEVETFKRIYLRSLTEFSKLDNEVSFMYSFLKSGNRKGIQFNIQARRKILLFYDKLQAENLPLTKITVKINEWINLLKSFSLFNGDNLSKKLEKFKNHVYEANEEFLEIDGFEFLKALNVFYESYEEPSKDKKSVPRKGTSKLNVSNHYDEMNVFKHKDEKFNGITIGKMAKRFGEENYGLLTKGITSDQQGIFIRKRRTQENNL